VYVHVVDTVLREPKSLREQSCLVWTLDTQKNRCERL